MAFTAGANGGQAITTYQYSTDGGSTWKNRTTGSTASPIVITQTSASGTSPLVNGTAYDVRIRAVNGVPTGASSNQVSATPVTFPAAPVITGITPGNKTLTVDFTAGSNGGQAITNYQYSTNNGANWKALPTADTTSPITFGIRSNAASALSNGTSYTVLIRAVNGIPTGVASNAVTAIPGTPTAPNITSITPGTRSLTVAFDAPTSNNGSAITNYQYSTNGGTNWKALPIADTTSPISFDISPSQQHGPAGLRYVVQHPHTRAELERCWLPVESGVCDAQLGR